MESMPARAPCGIKGSSVIWFSSGVQVRCWSDFVAKVFFVLVIKISFSCTRDFRWGTSSPDEKLAGDLGNVLEASSTGGRRSDFSTAEKLAPGNLGLLQQYLPQAD